ncbi:VirB8/TrbF family protein, partial [Vibrio parahaemolyticus]
KALTQETNDYLNQIKQFENDRVDMAKQSAKTAWKVAAGAGALAGLALIALAVTMPLKEVEPYLLSVDSKTGFTTILKPLADAQKTTYGEALDRSWVNRYIIERNSYIW